MVIGSLYLFDTGRQIPLRATLDWFGNLVTGRNLIRGRSHSVALGFVELSRAEIKAHCTSTLEYSILDKICIVLLFLLLFSYLEYVN